MKKFIDFIGYHIGDILMGLLLSFTFLAVVSLTYTILSNLPSGLFPLLFSISIYSIETLCYLAILFFLFSEY